MEEIRARQTTDLPLQQLKGRHLPGQVVTLLKSMLAADPNDRPQAARELFLPSTAAMTGSILRPGGDAGKPYW